MAGDTPEPKVVVPGFRVERFLGAGGFGVVVAATSDAGERVAIKVATTDAVAISQLARKEKALRAVGGVVAPAVRGSGTSPDGSPWLALELLEPPTLLQRLAEVRGPMERAELGERGVKLIDAVGLVHAAGFIHLDLKPDNVFLTREGVRLI